MSGYSYWFDSKFDQDPVNETTKVDHNARTVEAVCDGDVVAVPPVESHTEFVNPVFRREPVSTERAPY